MSIKVKTSEEAGASARRGFLKATIGLGALTAILGVQGCGFELRQTPKLEFNSICLIGTSGVIGHLRRLIRENRVDVKIVNNPLEADVLLEIVSERNVETVVGQTPSGQVREKQLRVTVTFKLWVRGEDPEKTLDVLEQYRESSYSETQALAKSEEEDLLYDDMRRSIAEHLLWRLAAMQPQIVTEDASEIGSQELP